MSVFGGKCMRYETKNREVACLDGWAFSHLEGIVRCIISGRLWTCYHHQVEVSHGQSAAKVGSKRTRTQPIKPILALARAAHAHSYSGG
jgi:hypothetical protein